LAGIATKFVAVKDNLVDKVHTPPARSLGQLKPYPVSLSGESTQSKLDRMREKLGKIARTENWLYLIPALPTITWLLNYRCTTDIPFCPVAFAYAALTPKSCIIFINKAKVRDEDILADWKEANVTIRPYGIDEVEKAVKEVGVQMSGDKGKFKIMAAREASWGLVKACEPVSRSLRLLTHFRCLSRSSPAPSRPPRPSRTRLKCKTSATPISVMDARW